MDADEDQEFAGDPDTDSVDCEKCTITSLALEPQNEQRGGPEIDSVQSGRDRPRSRDFSCATDASVDGWNAQKAVNPDDMANGPIDLNHVPRRLTSAEAQALGAIESRPA